MKTENKIIFLSIFVFADPKGEELFGRSKEELATKPLILSEDTASL